MLKKNDLIDMTITDLSSEGNGVGRYEGLAVFVPLAAVGDRLKVRIVKVLKNYCFGKIEEIIEPSNDRIEVDCPIFRRCGGCDFRHISYQSELALKGRRVAENMRRIGGIDLPYPEVISPPVIDRYRNKAIYPVRMQDGKLVIGFFAKRSHDVIDCSDCMLHPEFFKDIVEAVKDFIITNHISVYDEVQHNGLIRSLYIRHAEATGQVMVCLIINGDTLPRQEEFVRSMWAVLPDVASIVLNINQEKSNVLLGERCVTLYGTDNITDKLCGVEFEISPLSFYQVNRGGAERLYGVAKEFAGLTGSETLIDLYCGAGTIGLSMAKELGHLIGVDIVPASIENAKENARRNNITNAEFICADAADAAKKLEARGIAPDVVIIDPPRKGCEPSLIDTIAKMAPQRVVMVSCDSATAARDVALFEKAGYKAVKIQAVDLFCRTVHVEAVIMMTYCGSDKNNKG